MSAPAAEPTSALQGELAAALRAPSGPSHAYLLVGPRGSGKSDAARTFAAEILAKGAPDADSARRRALADPSPHPDLVWLRPPGAQHLVEDVRSEVIRAAALRPAEGEARVFVIEAAEAMREESQNALLKTLEEPAPFAHLILICSEPDQLASTIASRCQVISFAPLSAAEVAERLAGEGTPEEIDVVARLCRGDLVLARHLLSPAGQELRAAAEGAARAPVVGDRAADPWKALLAGAEAAGSEATDAAEQALREASFKPNAKMTRDQTDQVKRAGRRARTAELDLGLGLVCAWYRDLSALAADTPRLAANSDRLAELADDARGVSVEAATHALELVLDTRRRLTLNVAEELALDALWRRLSAVLGGG